MNVATTELLHKVEPVLDSDCASKAAALLLDPETRLVGDVLTDVEVGEFLRILKLRHWNSIRTGHRIFGLGQLIVRLGQMDSSAAMTVYHFSSRKAAGSIFLDGREVLGAAIVDVGPKEPDLLSQFLSRKSSIAEPAR